MSPSGGSMRMVPCPATMSPTTAARVVVSISEMCPRACPGVCSTRQRIPGAPASTSSSPSSSKRSGRNGSRSAVRAWHHTGIPSCSLTARAPPTWSRWWWVSTTASGRQSSAASVRTCDVSRSISAGSAAPDRR